MMLRGLDSYFRFEVPEDAEYTLRIMDHLRRGSTDYVYRIELQPVTPLLQTAVPRTERYGQALQQLVVPRGNRFGTVVNASRTNFSGDLVLPFDNLPTGLTAHAPPMPANMNQMPVVLEAAADAPLCARLIDLTAHHVDPASPIRGTYFNRADFVVGPPNQSVYVSQDVRQIPVAVVEELPFQIEIVEPKVPLVQNGSTGLRIVARKQEGWDEEISVRLPFLPPGVGSATQARIEKGQQEVICPLNANTDARTGVWKVFALAQAQVNGTAHAASPLAQIEIAPPFVQFEMHRASCEQGQPAQLYCKINHLTAFDGTGTASLVGLPHKVTAPDLEFDRQTQELTFQLSTDPSSPVGKHSNVFCQVTVLQNGEPIVGVAGSTELQIDKPAPEPVAAAPPSAEPQDAANKNTSRERPLSRLEKLRREVTERLSPDARTAEESTDEK